MRTRTRTRTTDYMGDLTLRASTDGSTWTNVWSKSGNQGSGWGSASVVSNFTGHDYTAIRWVFG